ncbi:PaaI family thioesterase [Pseudovibrio exalbescens]|uniref:PaaI family thioesterase n=1 Tax=Pseudovibrio exalbescens TaxID=197461 RepID=UPI002365414E|nr:PaaI family thioesterase [Pseudovibrio exalbescens]MDD7910666.1 PaaI family thioesterase [Pseudovibrio exalbescens]
MSVFTPRFEGWRERVELSFRSQPLMQFIGANITDIKPGAVALELPKKDGLLQQHGFFHGGIISSIADVAAGWSALSLMAEDTGVLTAEFKLNLLNPGEGDLLLARGVVLKPGRMLTVVQSDVYCLNENSEVHVATGLFTMVGKQGLTL